MLPLGTFAAGLLTAVVGAIVGTDRVGTPVIGLGFLLMASGVALFLLTPAFERWF